MRYAQCPSQMRRRPALRFRSAGGPIPYSRRSPQVPRAAAHSGELDADLVAEAPDHSALPADDLGAGEQQDELIRDHDALGIKPRASVRDVGDETISGQ